MLKKHKWLKWLILAVILIFGWGYYSSSNVSIPIKTAFVKIGEIAPSISVSGEIKGRSASLSPKTIGVLSFIGVIEGDAVVKGRLIAKLDSFDTSWRDFNSAKSLYEKGFATKQQLDMARLQYESSCFISPISGVVSLVANKVGESVSPGMVVFSIVDSGRPYAEVQIDEADISEVREGLEVKVNLDAYPDQTFSGKLSNIGQEAELKRVGGRIKMDEEDKVFRARIDLDSPPSDLRVGMSINADIITEKKSGVLVAPREAVITKEDKQKIFVINGKKAKETIVLLGKKDSENVEIKSGLSVSQEVAITNLDKLKDGIKTKIEK